MTFFQSTSSSSATIIGMEVFTFCPNSGFGDMIVTTPLSPIFTNPLISNHASGMTRAATEVSGLHPANQLKPIIMPPPASAEALRKDRLLKVVFTIATVGLV